MLLGALPAQAGFPGAGGPIPPSSRFPYPQPDFRMNRHAPIPSTWMQPQNLLRVSDKTNYDPYARASAGNQITSALRGLGSPVLGDAAVPATTVAPDGSSVTMTVNAAELTSAYRLTALMLVGGTMAGLHGYRRNKGSVGYTMLWSALGALFPIITNGVALVQGYGKPHG